jgi:hypothetical protein
MKTPPHPLCCLIAINFAILTRSFELDSSVELDTKSRRPALIEVLSEVPSTDSPSDRPRPNQPARSRTSNVDHFFNIILSLLNNRTLNSLIDSRENAENEPSVETGDNFLLPTSYLQLTSMYKNCSAKLQSECCASISDMNSKNFSFVCYQCENNTDCPCLCNLALISFTSNSNMIVNPVLGGDLDEADNSSYEISLNFYTLILSIGLPCISILMIICTLISFAYCCKLRSVSSSLSSGEPSDSDRHGCHLGNTNLSFVYVDIDAENSPHGCDQTAIGMSDASRKYDGEPPKYAEIFQKSRQLDRLPTYKSFKEKSKLPFMP